MSKTTLTEDDLSAAPALADKIITLVTADGTRPPMAVAACACAMAAVAHLAECGPVAARNLFDHYYALLDKLQREGT